MNKLIIAAAVFAVLEWFGEQRNQKWLIYVTKPTVLILILTWIWINTYQGQSIETDALERLSWFGLGLFFCLVGDIFLMLPERLFTPGLVSFLLGHVSYIIGFGRLLPRGKLAVPATILAVIVIILSLRVYRKLSNGLDKSGKIKLKIPIAVYSAVISVMLYVAIITLLDKDWHYSGALLVTLGALSFYISDILNAWSRFVRPIPSARLKIMMTYHLAQISIAIGVIIRFIYQPAS